MSSIERDRNCPRIAAVVNWSFPSPTFPRQCKVVLAPPIRARRVVAVGLPVPLSRPVPVVLAAVIHQTSQYTEPLTNAS